MNRPNRRRLAVPCRAFIATAAASLAFTGTAAHTPPAAACAPVMAPGREPVSIASEEAAILYDARTGTEQFLRGATFESGTPDFGFLVPTPSAPTLSAAPDADALFAAFRWVSAPAVLPRKIYVWEYGRSENFAKAALPATGGGSDSFGERRGDAAPDPSWVRATVSRVGDLDAAVLQASDAASLAHWLKKHGYATRPALAEYLAPYVHRGWYITAFRIAGDAPARRAYNANTTPATIRPEPIRMTFHPARPFYPYRSITRPRHDLFFAPNANQTETVPPPVYRDVRVNCAVEGYDDPGCGPLRQVRRFRPSQDFIGGAFVASIVLCIVGSFAYAIKRWGMAPLR